MIPLAEQSAKRQAGRQCGLSAAAADRQRRHAGAIGQRALDKLTLEGREP